MAGPILHSNMKQLGIRNQRDEMHIVNYLVANTFTFIMHCNSSGIFSPRELAKYHAYIQSRKFLKISLEVFLTTWQKFKNSCPCRTNGLSFHKCYSSRSDSDHLVPLKWLIKKELLFLHQIIDSLWAVMKDTDEGTPFTHQSIYPIATRLMLWPMQLIRRQSKSLNTLTLLEALSVTATGSPKFRHSWNDPRMPVMISAV